MEEQASSRYGAVVEHDADRAHATISTEQVRRAPSTRSVRPSPILFHDRLTNRFVSPTSSAAA
jgi:hypothetical protein